MFLRRFTDIAIKKPRISLLFIAAIVAVLGTSMVVHAASAGATIKLGPSGTLANPPNSVVVTVQYSCIPSQFNFGEVQIDQSQPVGPASGSRTDVFGFGGFQPTCDDKTHHDQVVVTAFGGSFVPGTAGASAFVGSGAVFAQTTAEISIK
jgi:hypothetical protein